MSKKYVKVPIKRYINLKNLESELLALEAQGVEDWPGYEEAEFSEFTEDDITLPIIEED